MEGEFVSQSCRRLGEEVIQAYGATSHFNETFVNSGQFLERTEPPRIMRLDLQTSGPSSRDSTKQIIQALFTALNIGYTHAHEVTDQEDSIKRQGLDRYATRGNLSYSHRPPLDEGATEEPPQLICPESSGYSHGERLTEFADNSDGACD